MTHAPTPTRAELLATVGLLSEQTKHILEERNRAYSGDDDVFGNLNLVETLSNGRISTEAGIVLRMGDKVSRLFNLTQGADAGSEKMEDTILDLIGYCALLRLRTASRSHAAFAKLQRALEEASPQPPLLDDDLS